MPPFPGAPPAGFGRAALAPDTDATRAARLLMVERQIVMRGLGDEAVTAAMRAEPRHFYVPEDQRAHAYEDRPLPVGFDQTISQPYIVALMLSWLGCKPGDRVLDVGTGSGYQAALLDRMGCEVYSIEIVEALCRRAAAVLAAAGHGGVRTRCGDGYAGWPEAAPFAGIVVAAAPREVPPALVSQLEPGARLVIPVGDADQALLVLTKRADGGVDCREVERVRFVPMTGEAEDA